MSVRSVADTSFRLLKNVASCVTHSTGVSLMYFLPSLTNMSSHPRIIVATCCSFMYSAFSPFTDACAACTFSNACQIRVKQVSDRPVSQYLLQCREMHILIRRVFHQSL